MFPAAHNSLVLQVREAFPVQRLFVARVLTCVSGALLGNIFLWNSVCSRCLSNQLALTRAFHERRQETCFLDGATNRESAMIPQKHALAFRPSVTKSAGETLSLVFGTNT